jgi:hypothetical protein
MSGLWKNHPAPPHQQALLPKTQRKRNGKPNQADVLITMLREARSPNRALELPAPHRSTVTGNSIVGCVRYRYAIVSRGDMVDAMQKLQRCEDESQKGNRSRCNHRRLSHPA